MCRHTPGAKGSKPTETNTPGNPFVSAVAECALLDRFYWIASSKLAGGGACSKNKNACDGQAARTHRRHDSSIVSFPARRIPTHRCAYTHRRLIPPHSPFGTKPHNKRISVYVTGDAVSSKSSTKRWGFPTEDVCTTPVSLS